MAGVGGDASAMPARLVAELRVGVDPMAGDVDYQVVYETWLSRECWQIEREALPLLVGVDPQRWPEHVARHGLARTSQAALHALVDAFDCTPIAALEPQRIAQWARQQGIALPLPFARVLEFLQQVLPSADATAVASGGSASVSDRERVLGAALALVSRDPACCRDASGRLASDPLATLILAQSPASFPDGRPALGRDDIVAVLESYLR